MSDLISRAEVLKTIDENGYVNCKDKKDFYANCRMDRIRQNVSEIPTAFDVEKVIDELEGMIDSNVDSETGIPCDNWVVDMQNEIIAKCIEIVKKFGARKGE